MICIPILIGWIVQTVLQYRKIWTIRSNYNESALLVNILSIYNTDFIDRENLLCYIHLLIKLSCPEIHRQIF
ncbi:MAG: hypothetical protein ACI85U_003983 [Candidatus Promineifilaceae bacterium]|jgi:hypothetical protein